MKTFIRVSPITGKYHVFLWLNGTATPISSHKRLENAESAARVVRATFGLYSEEELKSQKCFKSAVSKLRYETDDDPIAIIHQGDMYFTQKTIERAKLHAQM